MYSNMQIMHHAYHAGRAIRCIYSTNDCCQRAGLPKPTVATRNAAVRSLAACTSLMIDSHCLSSCHIHIWQLGYPKGMIPYGSARDLTLGVSQRSGVCVVRTWDETSRGIKQSFKSVSRLIHVTCDLGSSPMERVTLLHVA